MKAKAINASAPKRAIPSGKKGAIESPDMALASKIRLATEKKEMIKRTTIGLYSLKVGDSLYGIPFCSLNDCMALKAQKEILPQANVYKVGTFCQYDGLVVRFAHPVRVLDTKVEVYG